MGADALAPCVARSLTTKVSIKSDNQALVFRVEEFILHNTHDIRLEKWYTMETYIYIS